MGKHTKNSKSPSEVSVRDDVSQSSLGVCTRAKTLGLRRLRSFAAYTPPKNDLRYLELRSRRLLKRPPLRGKYVQNSQIISIANEDRERGSRVKLADSSTSGSTTKRANLATLTNRRPKSCSFIHMPTADEVEEYFAHEERLWQHLFIEKYNFDVVNDLPLPGRYEWVKGSP